MFNTSGNLNTDYKICSAITNGHLNPYFMAAGDCALQHC